MTVLTTAPTTPKTSPIDERSAAMRAHWTEQLLVMMRSRSTAESIEQACRMARDLLALDVALVTRISGNSQTVMAATVDDLPSPIPVCTLPCDVFAHRGVMMVGDVRQVDGRTPAADALGLRCVVAVPIVVENRPWGLLAVGSPRPRRERFHEMTPDLMDALGSTLSHLIDRDLARSRLVPIDRLRQSNRELERYAYAAAHDLRTPLRAIRNFTELALDAIDLSTDPARPRALLLRAIDNAQRMDDLLMSMLEHARATDSTGPIQPVDLRSEILRVIDTVVADHGCDDATVELGPLPVLEVDLGQLRRVLHNIIENAVKYRRQDRPLRFTVSCRLPTVLDSTMLPIGNRSAPTPPTDTVELSFTDNGTGIAPEMRASAFDLFRRHVDDDEGTGVGLTIVRRIMEELGGSASLADGHDGGLTVRLSFPSALVTTTGDEMTAVS